MKKWLMAVGLVVGMYSISGAAVPLQNGTNPSVIHAQVWTSSSTAGGGISQVILPAVTNYSNCFNYMEVGMPLGSTFYILDGATTDYIKYGQNLVYYSTASYAATLQTNTGTYTHPTAAVEPVCGTAGNTMTLQTQGTGTSFINIEGYTSAGPGKN